jgi:hypothetical protein
MPALKINELGFTASGAAWIELYNASGTPLATDRWRLAASGGTYLLPALTIDEHDYLLLLTDDSFTQDHPGFDGSPARLPAGARETIRGEAGNLRLLDGAGMTIDAISWGGDTSVFAEPLAPGATGRSLERRIAGLDRDLPDDFIDNARPTPGRGLTGDATAVVRLGGGRDTTMRAAAVAVPLALLAGAAGSVASRRLRGGA